MNINELKVTIVIPAYNAEKTIGLALSAALAQGCPVCDVLVVDDGSTDGTAEAVKRYPHARYVRQKNAGPAAARNTGWKNSDSEFVIFTDSDCVPEPGWAKRLMEGFTGEAVGAATGSYDIANADSLLPRLIHEEIKDRHVFYKDEVKFFGSYNVAVRRSVLAETGGFDEGYRRASGEDNDLSYRVLKAGYTIRFVPGALVAHHHTERLIKYLKEQYTHGFWRMKLYRAHPDMAGGDDYTKLKDVAEPPLSLLNLALMFLLPLSCLARGFVWPWMTGVAGWGFAATLAVLLLMQVPAAVRIALRHKDAGYLALAPVTFLRGYARGLGLLFGFVRFNLKG